MATQTLNYAEPSTPRHSWRIGWRYALWLLPVFSIGLSGLVIYNCLHIVRIWPMELSSWCGTGRLGIWYQMGQAPWMLLAAGLSLLAWRGGSRVRPWIRVPFVAAIVCWAIVYGYVGAEFTYPTPMIWIHWLRWH